LARKGNHPPVGGRDLSNEGHGELKEKEPIAAIAEKEVSASMSLFSRSSGTGNQRGGGVTSGKAPLLKDRDGGNVG